jgi:hypothetical protein
VEWDESSRGFRPAGAKNHVVDWRPRTFSNVTDATRKPEKRKPAMNAGLHDVSSLPEGFPR